MKLIEIKRHKSKGFDGLKNIFYRAYYDDGSYETIGRREAERLSVDHGIIIEYM
jgi:hypothetical protein